MGGRKVKLAFMANDAARRATYRKRRKGLMQKLSELTTLCGIEACAVVYKPNDPEPEIWPSPEGVEGVLARFTEIPEFERNRKAMNQESYLKQRIQKVMQQLKKKMNDNRKKEMTLHLYQCLGSGKVPEDLSFVDQNDLTYLIDQKMEEIEKKMEELEKDQMARSQDTVFEPIALDDEAAINDDQGLEKLLDLMQN